MLRFLSTLVLVLLGCVQAQFIQRWTWQNLQAPNSDVYVPTPFWHREAIKGLRQVLIPATDIILEYNCNKMPAICQNVRNWEADASKSTWAGRQAGWFTFDFGQRAQQRFPGFTGLTSRADIRREFQCPKETWAGTRAAPRCPEPNQPNVVPLWANGLTGQPITDIVPQDLSEPLKKANLEIMYWSSNPQNPTQSRRRSASWIEGGVGTAGQGNPEGDGSTGTTYCAPISNRCGNIGSEQNWQGLIHASLARILFNHFQAQSPKVNPTQEDGIAFRFRLLDGAKAVAQRHGARVYFLDAAGAEQFQGKGGFRRRSGETINVPSTNTSTAAKLTFADNLSTADLVDAGWVYAGFVMDDNSTEPIIEMPSGEVITAGDTTALNAAVKLSMTVVNGSTQSVSFGDTDDVLAPAAASATLSAMAAGSSGFTVGATPFNTSSSVEKNVTSWNITAGDVDESLTTYDFQTQRQPQSDMIDIIGLSEQYILGQLSGNSTRNSIGSVNGTRLLNETGSAATWRRSSHHQMHQSGALTKRQAVEGPMQCGPGKPCLDGSCCNSDGKCGFKLYNCGEKCISNCDAKAMCGIDSADGQTSCGLKLCCSFYGWCGTEDVHCKDPEPQYGKTPCQAGFGSCDIKPSPSCGKSSGTAKGRRIGYYQGWNTRERKCDKVAPRQINTRGLTHLFYSFAFFHPTTFEIMPMNDGDIPIYGEFTSLKRNGLQTWIAIGGWSFNDPGTKTYNAYSDMVSTQGNRAAFVSSLIHFMDTYGFQGADIDWEYPAEPKRGGRKEDTDNLVLLMKEMHAAFAGRYGSSLTIAPDYWYLRGFKPAAMQDYVDFMGFMSYDLHGPWDQDVKTLGSIVRPQTDITEIDKNLKPL
ncbi:chitinase [Parastagonospora nodorum]|nr:chitinase [Parastagonospora nodorum]KAH4260653.1 chitinase [Parastagonospora nodorum]KAH5292900.1 chitinase [Parastagonospora nodorum]